MSLGQPTGAAIADGQGLGTIVDDEPRISIRDVARLEGRSGTTQFVFTVTLSAASDVPVTVNFATANGSATAGSAYQEVPADSCRSFSGLFDFKTNESSPLR